MRYEDYINLNFKPTKGHLITTLYAEAENLNHAIGGVAAESSIGTWKEISTEKQYMKELAATVYSVQRKGKGAVIKIAYPPELFEDRNMANILSGIAGNIFGLGELKCLKLLDINFPYLLLKTFPGPKYGIDGIRKLFKVKRPLLGTIIKPKIGLNTADHAKVAYESWLGGCDIVKDDENLASQKFDTFGKRLKETFKMKEKAEKITGEKKVYMVNVTAETKEMLKRAELAEKIGNEYTMVDVITVGWSALQTLREANFNLVLHGHRAGYAALTRGEFGISMPVIAKIARMLGVDQLHVGNVVGKMFESLEEVRANISALKEDTGQKQVMPVASGGLHPLHIPQLIKFFGNDLIIQMGGGIHGHTQGTVAGARAARQALEATTRKISLIEYAKKHSELKEALKSFK